MKHKIQQIFEKYGVNDVSCDSRNLKSDSAFFAIKGQNFDGNSFIDEALDKGAIVFADINFQNKRPSHSKIVYVEDLRYALDIAIDLIYPQIPKNLLAVTGTNGKSSVVSYIHQILALFGYQSAFIGTIGVESTIKLEQELFCNNLTTPNIIDLRKILHVLNSSGVDNVAFEASSHGLDQGRLRNLKVKTAGFTSFSQDHLDYHKTMELYLKAKLELFVKNLDQDGLVVINSDILDSKYGDLVKDFLQNNKIHYCLVGTRGDVKINKIDSNIFGGSVYFSYKDLSYHFKTNIIGSFQATNLLIAARMVENLGIDFGEIINRLDKISPVEGRLQRVGRINDPFQVFVDYAHTPDALEKSIIELKKIKNPDGKLYVIFGCGGDRDHEKRRIMGEIASRLADHVIVTDDNPRNEDPAKIRADIIIGVNNGQEIASREIAIESTIQNLQQNDIVLIAGKGHENYQIIKDKKIYFSDLEISRVCLSNKLNNNY